MRIFITASMLALAALPAAASAQSATDSSTKEFAVTGNVPALCTGGTLTGDGTFDLGVLTDTATGLLRTDLSAPDQVITGSFCSTRSTIEIAATAMTAQNATATPPAGFSRTVNYVATASGWTTTPASFDTAATTNSAAMQTRDTAFTGDIAVALSNFSTGGGDTLRMVSDTDYQGSVTVTLTAAN
ncbi:hypothetical protein LK12_04705 [Novosphingobium malaysiense]|uniref:Spore coat protein U domain-containing protein n=2 Tax=Novosphingobium malaysiense TaxID=1348853 RepID=A0A0B1ZX34_9SPHN|nr:hypothetical protein LK12_04705 [Novosphingobium malaysiense]